MKGKIATIALGTIIAGSTIFGCTKSAPVLDMTENKLEDIATMNDILTQVNLMNNLLDHKISKINGAPVKYDE